MDTEDQVIESEQGQPIEEPQVEEEVEEVVEEVEDEPAEEESEEEEVEEPKLSPRAEKRIEQLKIKSLIADIKQKSAPAPSIKPELDYSSALEAEPEVLAQFEQDRQNYGQANYQAGLEQAKAIQFTTRLEIDAPKIESKYPVLNKDSEDFNPAVADALNEMYLSSVGYDRETGLVANPNIRYADYIEGIMELVDRTAATKTQKSAKNIARQAAQTGLRPDGSKAKSLNLSKAPEDMSDEELNAFISKNLKI